MNKKMYLTYESTLDKITSINDSFDLGTLRIAYHGKNPNNSFISKQSFQNAIPSMFNVPVVGNYQLNKEDKNGETGDFGSHDAHVELRNGEVLFINDTSPIGVVFESAKNWWEEIEDTDGIHEYLCSEVILWKRQPAYQKLSEEKVFHHSMEISIKDGNINDEGIYEIKDFTFTAFCILSNSVEPCFEQSQLQVFNKANFSNEFTLMLEEMKETLKQFSLQQLSSIPVEVNIPSIEEGGTKIVDEKIELLNTYSALSEEVITDLKTNLEQYTLETLKVKLDELSVVEPVAEFTAEVVTEPVVVAETPVTEFSLTVEQTRDSFMMELMEEKYTDKWGYTSSRYCYIDYSPEDLLVYAQDCQEGCVIVSFAYSMNGDEVVIDFATKTECKIQFVPKVGEEPMGTEDEMFSMVLKSVVDYELECKGKAVSAEKDVAINEVNAKFTLLETEVAELREYKTGKIASDEYAIKESKINDLFAKKEFEVLTEEEVSELKVKAFEMDLASVEKDLFALVGMKLASKFSLVKNEDGTSDVIKMSLDMGIVHEEEVSTKPYAGIIKKYSKQK